MPSRFIFRQLARPTGLFARYIGRKMNAGNANMNAFAVRQLELKPTDRVLEIGFGGGATLPSLLDNAALVGGVDPSRAMVKWATKRHSAAVKAGRADFREGSVEALPFEAASFDKACTVNTVYFWRSLESGFADIHRVLAPGGRVVTGFLPKESMDKLGYPTDIFTSRSPEEVVEAAKQRGFNDVRIARPESAAKWIAVLATR